MDKSNLGFCNPILVIGFKGHPINRFVAEVYVDGVLHHDYKLGLVHCDIIHAAYQLGLEHLEQVMKDDKTYYRIEKYHLSLQGYANRKYFKSRIKRILYAFYLWVGKLFNN